MTTPTIAERVAAGAKWLDKQRPDWVDRISLDRLDLGDCKVCVLGQVYGDFWLAPISGDSQSRFVKRTTELGFADDERRYTALGEAWSALIDERRADVS